MSLEFPNPDQSRHGEGRDIPADLPTTPPEANGHNLGNGLDDTADSAEGTLDIIPPSAYGSQLDMELSGATEETLPPERSAFEIAEDAAYETVVLFPANDGEGLANSSPDLASLASEVDKDFSPPYQELSPQLQETVNQLAGDEPELDSSDPTREFMDFRVPFDGMQESVSVADAKAAGAVLSLYIDERSSDSLFKTGVAESCSYNDGELEIVLDDGKINAQIREDMGLDGPGVEGYLSVNKHLGSGEFGEGARYELWTDGIVRRVDRHASTEQEQFTELDLITNLARTALNDQQNLAIEHTLGLNNQPVGVREVARLLRFVETIRKGQHNSKPE